MVTDVLPLPPPATAAQPLKLSVSVEFWQTVNEPEFETGVPLTIAVVEVALPKPKTVVPASNETEGPTVGSATTV